MSVSIHSILELNNKKPLLNNLVKFFQHEDKNYAYLNRRPYKISFLELSSKMLDLFKQFNGQKTINDFIVQNSLDASFFDLIDLLYRNSFLKDSSKPDVYPDNNLLSLVFFPTTTCNLRCLYCYASAGENHAVTIDLKKAEAWINYVFSHIDKKITTIRVLFHGGGEPTTAFELMKNIWEMVKAKSKEAEIACSLHSISNGNFNEKVLNWFIEERAVTLFSMDGGREQHDALRPRADGKGSFDPALANLEKLRAAGLRTGIRCTVTKSNINNMKDLVDIGSKCGVRLVNFEMCSSFGRSDALNRTSISGDEFTEKFLDVWKYALGKGVQVKGFPTIAIQPGRNFFCNTYNELNFALTPEGYLSPCPEVSLLSDKAADTFFTGKINEDGSIAFYNDRIQKLKERTGKNISDCRECFLEYVCHGGCPVKSFRKNNDLLKTDREECDFIKELAPVMLKTILDGNEVFPEKIKFDRLNFSGKNNDFSVRYVAFNSFNF